MDVVTYVVDAQTFLNNIHELKLWIYDGSIQILVPICTLTGVEQQWKASLVPKEVPKEKGGRKPYGKAGRKDLPPPLFDINPRTAWEFLMRAQTEQGEPGVTFQTPEETFSQWREERQTVQNIESPQAPPTSFADALLRKLNINDGSNSNGSNDNINPRLVTRSSESKSPLKHHQVPTIPSTAVPVELQSYFSYVLWCFYELENDPLNPKIYRVLSENTTIKSIAATLEIPVQTPYALHKAIREFARKRECREATGQVDQEFAQHSKHATPVREGSQSCEKLAAVNGDHGHETSNLYLSEVDPTKPVGHIAAEQKSSAGFQETIAEKSHSWEQGDTSAPTIAESLLQKNQTMSPKADDQADHGMLATAITAPVFVKPMDLAPSLIEKDQHDSLPSYAQDNQTKADTEDDSDEEVIVFNPRAKRASGRPKTPGEAPRSRPTTAHGPIAAEPQAVKIAKSPIISNLKPQSPAFTPGQAYVATTTTTTATHHETRDSSIEETHAQSSKSPNGAPRSPQPKSSQPKSQRHSGHVKSLSQDNLQRQQSELIIQRQREAIQRQTKAVPKPAPRQVQMQPTENPTIIDPDAFDRSYVVQQPNQASSAPTGKPRSAGKPRRSPKGSPKRPSRPAAEPDVDYVLKSGNPRGSMRGKGKLWVP